MPWRDLCTPLWVAMLLSPLLSRANVDHVAYVQVPSSDLTLETFKAANADSYKTLVIYSNVLYIGGRGTLYRQNPDNITMSRHPSISWKAMSSEQSQCRELPSGSKDTCYNFIRIIQRYNRTHMFLCGSMAYQPKNMWLRIQDGSLHDVDSVRTPLCSFNPADEVSSLLVKKPSTFYSIAATSRTQTQGALVKTLPLNKILRTSHGAGKMVDVNPKFTHSFRHLDVMSGRRMEKLYFVFAETTREQNGVDYGSRIAQVCASDRGNVYSQGQWTTYLKAPLLCQTGGSPPFKFNVVTHSVVSEDGMLYATFVPSIDYLLISAVCAYKVSDIQATLHGRRFWESSSSGYFVKTSEIPQNPSPGECPYPGMGGHANATTEDFDPNLVTFMLAHPLVASSVTPSLGKGGPLFTLKEEYMTKIAIQKVRAVDGKSYDVIFVATKSGKVYKYASIVKSGEVEMVGLAEYSSIGAGGEITGLLLSSSRSTLYVQTAADVKQMSTGNCEVYVTSCDFCDPCRMCMLARDPMCAWDSHAKRCVDIRYSVHNSSVLHQSIESTSVNECDDLVLEESLEPVPHEGVHVVIGTPVVNPSIDVEWFNHTSEPPKKLEGDTKEYRVTTNKRLEINTFAAHDVGRYDANYRVGDVLVAMKAILFTDHTPTPSGNTTVIFPSPGPTDRSNPTTTPGTNATSPPTQTMVATATPLAAGTLVGIVLAFVVLLLLVLLFFCVFKKKYRDCRLKAHKYQPDHKSPRYDDDVTDGARFTNTNNSNAMLTSRGPGPTDDVTQEEKVHLMTELSVPTQQPLPPQELIPSSQKKVAKVLPYGQGSSSPTMEFIDDVTTPLSDEDRRKKPPQRTKSIPSQNIRVKIADDRVVKCNSIRRDKQRGTWFLEIDLPEDCVLDEGVPEGKKMNFEGVEDDSSQDHVDEVDTKADFQPSDDPQAAGDSSASMYLDLSAADTDSDSTLKASNSTMKQFDSPASSAASTPRQYDTTKPLLASSYHPRFMANVAAAPEDSKGSPSGQWYNKQTGSPSLMRREPTRNDKSPISTDSSSSNSSDKFHTAPPSPVGGAALGDNAGTSWDQS